MLKNLGVVSIFSILTPALALAQCDNDGLRNGLLARYTFNDGLAADTSGLGNHGTIAGATPGPGINLSDLVFDSDGDYVTIPNSSSLNPATAVTLSAWYFAANHSGLGSDPLIDKGAGCHCHPYYQYHLSVTGTQYGTSPGSFGFHVATSAGNVGAGTPPNTYTAGNWDHVVGAYNGTTTSIWVNGGLISRNPTTTVSIPDIGRPVTIGHYTNLGFSLRGGIDEVRIFGRGLTDGEIRYLYQHPDDSPGFIAQPESQVFCRGNSSVFTVAINGATPTSYQWFRNNNLLTDSSSVSGANSPTLTISNAQTGDAGLYHCIVGAACGNLTSDSASLEVCPANFNCDSAVDFFDYLDFVDAFSANNPNADFNYDEVIDFFDYLDFVDAFSSGC